MTMDRVAQLAEEAENCLRFERECAVHWNTARASTRECLAEFARDLGFPEHEISAAIDTALGGR